MIAACGIEGRLALDGVFGAAATAGFWPGFAAHAVDPDRPFLSETGYRSFMSLRQHPQTRCMSFWRGSSPWSDQWRGTESHGIFPRYPAVAERWAASCRPGIGDRCLRLIDRHRWLSSWQRRVRLHFRPDFRFGHEITRVIDAVLKSVAERRWVRIDEI